MGFEPGESLGAAGQTHARDLRLAQGTFDDVSADRVIVDHEDLFGHAYRLFLVGGLGQTGRQVPCAFGEVAASWPSGIARSHRVLNPRTMPIRIQNFVAATALALPLTMGCSKQYIPNTDVEDTAENRKVVAFCESYRKAVERKDIAKIIGMASPQYYEDGGNVDASDDLDFAGLKAYMTDRFLNAKAIRYEIRYRRVLWSEESDRVYVDYTYSASFRIPGAENQDEWRRRVDENRLELEHDGETFKILSGL